MFRTFAMGLALVIGVMLMPITSPAPAMQLGLGACPNNATALRGTGELYTCDCSASAARSGSVWGSDVYSDDSNICRAAVHYGHIGENGGSVTFQITQGADGYDPSLRNGVQSNRWGAWAGSFVFSGGIAECPENAIGLRGTTASLSCYCPASATGGDVWGTLVYTDDSSICRAAVHAGVIGWDGGMVVVRPLPGQSSYEESYGRGVATDSYGAWHGSFGFE